MRNRIFAVLAIAVLAGGGLAYGTYNLVQPRDEGVRNVPVKTQPVVVAAADLSLGAELKQDDLKVVSFPDGQAPEGVSPRLRRSSGAASSSRSSRTSRFSPPSLPRRKRAPGCRR